jgi:DNA-binding CsgD family transcriptional regulator
MNDAAHLLEVLAHVYGAQSPSSNISSSIVKGVSPVRVSEAQCSTFENLLTASRDVGHELLAVLANKLALAGALDQLACALFMVTVDLQVLSVNKPARELVDAGCGLTIVNGRLVCKDGRSQQKFERAVQRLQSKAALGAGSVGVRVIRGSDQADLQLHILGCGMSLALSNTPEIPAYYIWVFDPGASRTIDCDLLREIHGLTAAEASVTTALFRGLSIDEAASELSVTVNTVKTHLKHVFQKCEVRSQAELLQMLALGPRGR